VNKQANPEQLFLSVKQVSDRYGVSDDTIWRWVRVDQFPRPVKLGGQTTRWRLADIMEHESALVAGCTMIFDWERPWPIAA
jgi:prophage regulatory protein